MIEDLKKKLKDIHLEIAKLKDEITREEFGDLGHQAQEDAVGELEYLENSAKELEKEINRLQQQDTIGGRTLDNARLAAEFDEAGLTVEDLGFVTETTPRTMWVSNQPVQIPSSNYDNLKPVDTPEAVKALEELKFLEKHIEEINKKLKAIDKLIYDEIGPSPKNKEQNDRLAAALDKTKAYKLYLVQIDYRIADLEQVVEGAKLGDWKEQQAEAAKAAGVEPPENIDLLTRWNGVLSDEDIFKQYEEAKKIERPLEQRASLSFVESQDKSKQAKTLDFFDNLTKKFDEFIANRPTDTTTFTGNNPTGHTFKWTIWNDKIIYIDLMMIKPERQGEFATSRMIFETINWMEKEGMHIVTQPANDWVYKSMVRNGGRDIGDGHIYFGTDIKQFEKDWLALYKPGVYGPANTYMDQYANLVELYTQLNPEQKKKYMEIVNQSNLDKNEMALVDSYVKEIGIDNVDFKNLDLWRMSTAFRVAREEMSAQDYFKIRNTGKLEQLLKGLDEADNIWNWMLSTESGVKFLSESLLEMEALNVDTSSEKYTDSEKLRTVLERRLKDRGLLNDVTLNAKEQENLLYSFGRQGSPYDISDPNGWYLDTHQWNFKVTDADLESFKKLYDPEFRKSFLQNLLGSEILGPEISPEEILSEMFEAYRTAIESDSKVKVFEIRRKYNNILRRYLTGLDYLQSEVITIDSHPTLDIHNQVLNVYHASTPINAALGFRTPEWDRDSMGGRTSGHGSNTYFATGSNYTQDYRGFGGVRLEGRSTYVYQIDLDASGIANENILNYHRPMSTQLTESLLDSVKSGMSTRYYEQAVPKIQEFLATDSGRSYNEFKFFLQREVGFKMPLSWWVDQLKDAGIKVVYHSETGRGDRQPTRILSSDGPVTIKGGPNTRGRNEEELLFLEPETLEYEVRELRNTSGATQQTHSQISDDDIIPFDKKNAMKDLIGGYYNRLSDTIIRDFPGNAYYLEDLLREFNTEIRNRPPNPLYDEYVQQLESVIKQVRNLIDEQGLTGKQILHHIDFDKLTQDVGGGNITFLHHRKTIESNLGYADLPEYQAGTRVDSDDILYRYELNKYNVQVKKFYKVIANDLTEEKLHLVGEDGIKIETYYDIDFIYDENINNPHTRPQAERLTYIRERINRVQAYVESLGKALEVSPTSPTQGYQQSTLLNELLTNQHTDRVLRIPVYYRNNEGVPLNPEDIRAGYNKGRRPIVNPQGDIEYLDLVEDLFTTRNTGGSITFALDTYLRDDNTFYQMTGEKIKPGATDNFFQIEVNTKNIVSLQQLKTGGWLTNFNIEAAADAFNLPRYKLLEYLEEAGLVKRPRSSYEIVGDSFFGTQTEFGEADIINEKTVKLAKLISPNKEVELVINKLLRAAGIEGYVNQPFLNMKDLLAEGERTSTFITLFDPNDYAGVGKHIPVLRLDNWETMGTNMNQFETVLGQDTPALTRYEDLNIAYDQRVLDEGFESRLLFDKGFNAAEREALGLTGEIGDLVNDNIFDKHTTQRVIETGNLIDDVAAINDATDMVISQIEWGEPITEEELAESIRKAIAEGKYIDLELLTRRGRAKALLNKKIVQFINYKGKVGAGIAFLDYFEIIALAAAASYGARDLTVPRFHDHLFDLTKGVLGKEYDVDSLELDMEEFSKSMEIADKVSPLSHLYRKIADRPFWQTVGDFDWMVRYGDGGFGPKPINPYRQPSIVEGLAPAFIAGITPYLYMSDVAQPYEGQPPMSDIALITNYNMPANTEIRQVTAGEAEYMDASPWGKFWLQFKDNYKDWKHKKIEEEKNPFWMGEHTPAVIRDDNPSMGIYEKYGVPKKKWYDIGRSW
tara:strand:- start:103 stop:5580 length:5478 start_codon:yes stop_codon:yes gene_type:complete